MDNQELACLQTSMFCPCLDHKDKLQVADLYAACNLPLWTSTFTNI